jgi:hypothetical protein
MRKSNLTNVDVEKKMTAGVRHAKIFATIIAVLLIMLTIYSDLNHMDNAAFQGAMLTCVALLARWLFDGMESIISLLYANGEAIGKIKLPEKIAVQSVSEKKTEAKPMTHDDPANWPKQEPVNTGIDVEAALRAAKEISRN